jgi:hypothetical protein
LDPTCLSYIGNSFPFLADRKTEENDIVDYISVATQSVLTPEGIQKGTHIPFYVKYADEQP